MNTVIELAKQLANQSILRSINENYHSSKDLIHELTHAPKSTMIYLKVFWNSSRFAYGWGKGYITPQDRDYFDAFNAELASDIDFLELNKRNCLAIKAEAGIANTAFGDPSVHNEPMTLTLTLSIEKACELLAVLQDKHATTIRSVSLIEMFNAVSSSEISNVIESKVSDAKDELIETLSKIKRGNYIHLPSVTCLLVRPIRTTTLCLSQSETLSELRKTADHANQSIKESLRNLGVLKQMESDTDYVRLINKSDFKRVFKASIRDNIYAEFPGLKEHYEPAKQAIAA
nr:hypothetical protein [Vibrio splendidus]MCC4883212.1 hypothetical protein [Vibrio splendidus]